MNYSDYITWKFKLSQYTGGICPADCISNLPCGGGGGSGSNALPSGQYFSDYIFYNNLTSNWQVGSNSVHLGSRAGATGIGYSSIAIGESANAANSFSIAIGSSTTLTGTNTIALNATGSAFTINSNSGFFVAPVRPATSANALYYNPFSKEITYGTVVPPNGIPNGATQYGEYLYFNGTSWAIGGNKVSIGAGAGASNQSNNAVAIGKDAGKESQGTNAIAIGSKAGTTSQHSNTIIINATGEEVKSEEAGRLYVKPIREGANPKALFYDVNSGEVTYDSKYEGSNTNDASLWSSFAATQDVDMSGFKLSGLGEPVASDDAVTKNYIDSRIPLGNSYGEYLYYDGSKWVASDNRVNLGVDSGRYSQSGGAVAIGWEAGKSNQSVQAIGIGIGAGRSNQKEFSVSIGAYAGTLDQHSNAVAIGYSAGKETQGNYAIAIGQLAGFKEQKLGAIAIGSSAGESNQGSNSIAIGNLAGTNSQKERSIVINATGVSLNADASGAFFVKPVRERSGVKALYYDVSSGEVSYSDICGGGGSTINGGFIGTNTLNNDTYKFRRYPYGLNINDGKTVADGQSSQQDTIANALAKIDDWIHSYLIAQPPAPQQIDLVKKATPTSIYLALKNPIQIKTAVFKKKLPLIEQVNVDISNNGTKYTAFSMDSQYIPDVSEINAFVITKVPVVPAYRQITLSGETYKAYYYYNSALAQSAATTNLVNFWYSNYSELSANVLSVSLPGFAEGSAPSAARNLLFNNVGQQTFIADWVEPEYSDLTNSIKSTDFDSPLLAYNFKYMGVHTIRCGGVFDSNEFSVNGINSSEYNATTNVYPGTKYIGRVFAYNNTISALSPETSGTLITLYPTAPPSFSTKSVSFSTNFAYTPSFDVVKAINDNSIVNDAILKNYENVESAEITDIPVHLYTNDFAIDKVINISNNIMKLEGDFTHTTFGTKTMNSLTYGGFPYTAAAVIGGTANDIELIDVSVNDYYKNGAAYNKGFYLTSDVKLLLKPGNLLKSSPLNYSLSLRQYLNNSGTSIDKTYNFYLDDLSGIPVITQSAFDIGANSLTKVSGVTVLNTPIQLNTITDVSNIASHFYVSNDLMKYQLFDEFNNLLSAININDISDGNTNYVPGYTSYSGQVLSFNNVKFSLNNVSNPNLFTKKITLKSRARNLIGYSMEFSASSNIIIDVESVKTVKLYDINDIPTLNSVSKSGRLNKSDSSSLFDLGQFSYFRGKYDQNEILNSNKTLQINKGRFTTPAYSDGSAYINYSGIEYNNSINYSGIVGDVYRYTTFIWKIDSTSGSYNNIQFKIKNIAGSSPTITNEAAYFGSIANKLLFYYRFENITVPDTLEQNKTSVWIDGNKTASDLAPTLSVQHTYMSNNGLIGGRPPVSNTLIISGNDMVYTLTIPTSLGLIENNAYIYALVGIPMNSPFAYSHIEGVLI